MLKFRVSQKFLEQLNRPSRQNLLRSSQTKRSTLGMKVIWLRLFVCVSVGDHVLERTVFRQSV